MNKYKVGLEFKLRILNWLFIFPIRDSDSPTAFPDENFDLGGQFILCIWDGDDGFLHLVVGNGHIWTSIIVVYSHVFCYGFTVIHKFCSMIYLRSQIPCIQDLGLVPWFTPPGMMLIIGIVVHLDWYWNWTLDSLPLYLCLLESYPATITPELQLLILNTML